MTKLTLLELSLLTHFKASRVDYCHSVELILHYSVYRSFQADPKQGSVRNV